MKGRWEEKIVWRTQIFIDLKYVCDAALQCRQRYRTAPTSSIAVCVCGNFQIGNGAEHTHTHADSSWCLLSIHDGIHYVCADVDVCAVWRVCDRNILKLTCAIKCSIFVH